MIVESTGAHARRVSPMRMLRFLTRGAAGVAALAGALALAGCSSDDKGSSGGSSSGSTSSSCSSETKSSQSYLCVGSDDASKRCKCASSSEDTYPDTEAEAEKACGSSTTTGNCPPDQGSSGSSGTSSGSSGDGTSSGGDGTSSGGDGDGF